MKTTSHVWAIVAATVVVVGAASCSDDAVDTPATTSTGAGGTGASTSTSMGGAGGSGGSGVGGSGGAAPQGPSCADILADHPMSTDGVYTLTTSNGSVDAYCDMTGGGWTLAFVSSQTATNKIQLDQFQQDMGTGALTNNAAQYAIAGFGSEFYSQGLELRLTWKCGDNLGAADVVGDASQLDSGTASWQDDRTPAELTASAGEYHNVFSNFSWSGSSCWTGTVRDDFVYGYSIGNGNGFGQYIGWFWCASCSSGVTVSTAVSDGAEDNVAGTVAGWFH